MFDEDAIAFKIEAKHTNTQTNKHRYDSGKLNGVKVLKLSVCPMQDNKC